MKNTHTRAVRRIILPEGQSHATSFPGSRLLGETLGTRLSHTFRMSSLTFRTSPPPPPPVGRKITPLKIFNSLFPHLDQILCTTYFPARPVGRKFTPLEIFHSLDFCPGKANIQRIICNHILKILNIVFSGGGGEGAQIVNIVFFRGGGGKS